MRNIDLLENSSNKEYEQAYIRLILALIVPIYLLFIPVPAGPSNPIHHFAYSPRSAILPYGLFATLIVLSIRISPSPNTIRKLLAIVADLAAASFVMGLTGEQGFPLTIFYLWVIMGNGFRYGTRYLLFAVSISIMGLFWVYDQSHFWKSHETLFWSQIGSLVLLPIYMVILLEKLQKTIKLANEANQAKSRFLANMSHELRTPLNGIIGMGDLMLETPLTSKQKNLLDTLQMSAKNLSSIIEKILDFSKGEAGRLTAQSVRFDFYETLQEAIATIEPIARKKHLPIKVFWDTRIPRHANGDPLGVRRVLLNLLGNAVKFTETGEILLSLNSLQMENESLLVRLEVSDTGIGIPENLQARVFESFYQGDDSLTKRFIGTGLGLSITKQLVELMNGRIGFWSKEGNGSTFWCEIPFSLPLNDQSPEECPPLPPRILFWSSRENPKGLIPSHWDIPVIAHHLPDEGSQLPTFDEIQSAESGPSVFLATIDQDNLERLKEVFQNPRNEPFLTQSFKVFITASGVETVELESLPIGGNHTIIPSPADSARLARAFGIQKTSLQPTMINPHQKEVSPPDPALRNGLSILVAEDHPVNQTVIRGVLESRGHSVHLVENGDMALDILSQDHVPFDLMILDLCMPVMGGLDVLNAYHFMDRSNPIPAIILTANATEEAIESSRIARARAFLTKPLDTSRLLDEVHQVFLEQSAKQKVKREPLDRQGEPSPLVNRTILQELRTYSQDPGFLIDLLEGFLFEGKKLFVEMDHALSIHDFLMFVDAVHALKGSALQIGADQLANRCRDAESVGFQEIQSGSALPIREQLDELFQKTGSELKAVIQDIQTTRTRAQPS
ncbi:MAG: ATP-binding protein [Leptospirales bacterium]